jgi:L-alanine-DL-glutamate epimerase-like enolase superfamily enzyme
MAAREWPAIDRLDVAAYTIPTDAPESDGTLEWDSTTMVVVEAHAGGTAGLGYSYADVSAAFLIDRKLAGIVHGCDPMAVPEAWTAMRRAVRNIGRPGIASSAIAAVDMALWDLKARLLGLSLARLLGPARTAVPVYGSGGFTSYSEERLRRQLGGWAASGIRRVKMKVGRDPAADPARVRAARDAIGPGVELFVDANGAYTRKQALGFAARFVDAGVTWFEEPVSSDDLEGLRLMRERAPAGMAVAAGEYGYDLAYFQRMLDAEAVDVLQADATRCEGITGFLKAAALCEARSMPLSAHTAPAVHAHPCCALPVAEHIEYFHDHVRIESLLFDGALSPVDGALHPDLSRPGTGLEFKWKDAERYRVYGDAGRMPPAGSRISGDRSRQRGGARAASEHAGRR